MLDGTRGSGPAADVGERLRRWRSDLAAWAIPEHITDAVSESPWVLPPEVFARRADQAGIAPSGPSYEREWHALEPPGSVLDIGSGAGAASLPLLPRTTELTAVDADERMLARLAERAAATGATGATARTIAGQWPEVAPLAGVADVVTCHHVLYNAGELAPFVAALTASARRLVVAEVTTRHPLTPLNPLWLRFHGLRRPDSPTAADLVAILEVMGLRPGHEEWRSEQGQHYASLEELAEVTRRRLCLPPERTGEVAEALRESGAGPASPASISGLPWPGRDLVTIWWEGGAG